MKIKQLILLLKRDDRKIGDIFQNTIRKTEIKQFRPIVCTDVSQEKISESEALRNAKPLTHLLIKELEKYD